MVPLEEENFEDKTISSVVQLICQNFVEEKPRLSILWALYKVIIYCTVNQLFFAPIHYYAITCKWVAKIDSKHFMAS